jgi:hypothetical protein
MSNFTRHALNAIMADDSANHDDLRTASKARFKLLFEKISIVETSQWKETHNDVQTEMDSCFKIEGTGQYIIMEVQRRQIPGLDHKTHSYECERFRNILKKEKCKNMKYVRIITIEDFPHSDKDEKGQDLQYIEHYVTVNAKNRKKEKFNEITYTSINLPAFRKAIPKERLKELLKTALEKLLSIYAYSSELTKEEVEDIYSGDENRIYREAYERLEMFNWPIERYNAYERSESDRLSMKDKFEQCYEDSYNESFKNGYNEGRKACFRPILSVVEVLWKVFLVVLFVVLLVFHEKVPGDIFKGVRDGVFGKALRRFSRIFNGRKSRCSSTSNYEDEGETFVEHQKEATSGKFQEMKTHQRGGRNKDTDGNYETEGLEETEEDIPKEKKGNITNDVESNLKGERQDKVTNENLPQRTFIENAGGLSAHQTINIQETIHTIEGSLQGMIQMFQQTMQIIAPCQEMISKLNQFEGNHQEVMSKLNQLEGDFQKMKKEVQEIKK